MKRKISKWLLFAMSGMMMAGASLTVCATDQVTEIIDETDDEVWLPEGVEGDVSEEAEDDFSEVVESEDSGNTEEKHDVPEIYFSDEFVEDVVVLYSADDPDGAGTNEGEGAEDYGTVIDGGECGAEGDNLIWTIYDTDSDETGDLLVISGSGAMADYEKVYAYDYYYSNAPWGSYVELCQDNKMELILEEGISYIGSSAFYQCPNLIGNLKIPDTVTTIGMEAFYGCSGFTGELIIPDSVTSIGEGSFACCSSFTGNLIIPDSITSLGNHAFAWCIGLTGELTIPDSVTSIGDYTFSDCSGLTGNLVIPNSITYIGENAFRDCSGLTGDLIIPNSVTKIGDYAFGGCSGLTGDLIIPDSITSLGNHAFVGCSGFTGELIIPDSLTSISDSTFCSCNGLTGNLVIPNSITDIGENAFRDCSGFEGSVELSENVIYIGAGAFADCPNITDVKILNKQCTLADGEAGEIVTGNTAICGYEGSTAQTYAEQYGLTFHKLSDNSSNLGQKIADFALQYVGNPYVYGGTSLTEGADASGFTQSVFANFGIKLLRVVDDQMHGPTEAQIINQGYAPAININRELLQPGDLVFYGSDNFASHVGIYIGNDQIIHAANSQPYPQGGIKVSAIDYQTPIQYVRYWASSGAGVCENHTVVVDAAVEATCIQEGKTEGSHCSVCGMILKEQEVIPVIQEHEWDDGQITKEATCLDAGEKTYHCKNCLVEKIEEIPATGHSWNTEYTIDKNPTYTEAGSKSIHCKSCEAIQENSSVEIPMLELPSDVILINAENFPDTVFREYIRENFDVNGDDALSADEVSNVTEMHISSYGEEESRILANDLTGIKYFHSLESIVVEIAEFEALDFSDMPNLQSVTLGIDSYVGVKKLDLSGCQNLTYFTTTSEELKSINVLGCNKLQAIGLGGKGDLVSLDLSDCIDLESLSCASCSLTEIDLTNNKKLKYLFLENNKLTKLDLSKCFELQSLNCSGNNLTYLDLSNQFNLSDGNVASQTKTVGIIKTETGWLVNMNELVGKDKINLVKLQGEWTMREDGYAYYEGETIPDFMYYSCATDCPTLYMNLTVKLSFTEEECEHNYVSVETDATCTQKGERKLVCSVCGTVKEGSAEELPLKEHSWDEGKVTVEPSCEKEGETLYTCTVCSGTKTEKIPVKGHVWNEEYTVDKEATCIEAGSKSIYCSVCGTVKEESGVKIPAKGHSWDEGKVTVEPSCENAGEKLYTCTICSGTKTEKIPAKGHAWNEEYTVDKEATCIKTGSKSIHCFVCGTVKEGSEVEIPAKGHSWDEGEIVIQPSCNKKGEEAFKCTACEAVKTEPVAESGHKWNAEYTIDEAATCTSAGSKSYHCGICGAKMEGSDAAINATGHTWGAWKQTVIPTVKEEGMEERECTVCHETEERSVAKLPLNLTTVKINPLKVVSGDHIEVSWNKVNGADGYLVYRRNNGKWKQIATVKGNAVSYVDKTTKIGTKYNYTVKAYTDLEDGTVYGGYNKTGVTLTQTYYKSSVKLTSAKATSTKAIQIKWKTRSKADGYIIYRKTPGSKWKKIATVGKKSSYTDKKCKSATTYLYTVKAYTKVNGKTIYSNYDNSGIAATTKMLKPTLKVSSKTKRKATITWSKQSNVSGYAIYRKEGSGKWTKIKTVSAKKSSYVDQKLKSGKTYYYAVKAYIKANPKVGIKEPIYSAYNTKKVKIK